MFFMNYSSLKKIKIPCFCHKRKSTEDFFCPEDRDLLIGKCSKLWMLRLNKYLQSHVHNNYCFVMYHFKPLCPEQLLKVHRILSQVLQKMLFLFQYLNDSPPALLPL